MPVTGTLRAMPITEIFEWLHRARRSGRLRVDRRNVDRRIQVADGRIVACASDEPVVLLGQFLLSHGRVTEEQLRAALERQETTGERVGEILVDNGVVTPAELDQFLAAKAREIVLSLFDWTDATFRFETHEAEDRFAVQVQFNIPDILTQGLVRREESGRFHEVFRDETLVLVRTRLRPPAELNANPIARRIFELVDGRRTLAEICLHSRCSGFLTTKFLFQLHKMRLVEVKPEPAARESAAPAAELAAAVSAPSADDPIVQLERDIHVALGLLDQNQCELAMDLLTQCEQSHPGNESVRAAVAQAESQYERLLRKTIDVNMVPRLRESPSEPANESRQSPELAFLPSLIDGVADVKSIMWLAPMRTIDVLKALKQMRDQGLIELQA